MSAPPHQFVRASLLGESPDLRRSQLRRVRTPAPAADVLEEVGLQGPESADPLLAGNSLGLALSPLLTRTLGGVAVSAGRGSGSRPAHVLAVLASRQGTAWLDHGGKRHGAGGSAGPAASLTALKPDLLLAFGAGTVDVVVPVVPVDAELPGHAPAELALGGVVGKGAAAVDYFQGVVAGVGANDWEAHGEGWESLLKYC
ncbi:hypothetical protein F5X68DRAFT_239973 [Plectosphaerella plurivora]|uniref:Uncharacterized protein n=1 Tax=Plectosphaerella plurivora TaxID=936078 RepID=A0A9P8VDJ1_9PEZI|nr:hypothetical protein F5X68DRAFT_239973 [Plectosphaerella plurivora]